MGPVINNLFRFILVILICIALANIFSETTYYNNMFTKTVENGTVGYDPVGYDPWDSAHRKIIELTNERINLVEEKAYVEAFAVANSSINTSVKGLSNTGFLSKSDKTNLLLFYKPNCPHCTTFMPTWTKILQSLPSGVSYQEINVSDDRATASKYSITGVPTLILEVNGTTYTYIGSRTYDDIKRFLREHGINIVMRTFDSFSNTGADTSVYTGYDSDSDTVANKFDDGTLAPLPTNKYSARCPLVNFDKTIDIANDSFKYQIFSADGQYGFAEGGYKPEKLMSPFQAAYSVVDSYLSSLPDINNSDNGAIFDNVDECATAYAEDINCFGLCDKDKLADIINNQNDVKNGVKNIRVNGTDYSSNIKVAGAIEKACRL